MEEIEQARIIEQAALAEIELEMAAYPEPDADVPEEEATEVASRTMLKRELRAQALLRLEDGARTEEDFKEVIKQWDHLDDNRERKERYHEIGREMNRLTEDAPKDPVVISYPSHHTYWRQMMKGDFLDVIFDCPFEMHEFLTDEDYSKIIYDLKDSYKELIYYLYIRDYSTLYVGNLMGQTDRNIRGVRSTILGQITKKVIAVLLERQEFDIPLWTTEQEFMEKHKEKIPDIQRKSKKEKEKIIREIGVLARKVLKQYQKNMTNQTNC
ncbi:MAG: sigma-70 family RNA polymerase sigma factor [Agathobacter rectalis]|nr:sigma-70 family RNA polymerase sigma factor [Agathobacter rectalis]